MTRIPIPPAAHQSAINAANDCRRIANALSNSSTFNELSAAESARNRAMDSLRSLGPQIRAAKTAAKQAEKRAEIDRRIIARDRLSLDAALEIPA